MNPLALAAQIAALTLVFSINHADAMAGAAIFAVLCVVVTALRGAGFRVTKTSRARS